MEINQGMGAVIYLAIAEYSRWLLLPHRVIPFFSVVY
jgi:hypothetical protein